jgi:hypothetical protein
LRLISPPSAPGENLSALASIVRGSKNALAVLEGLESRGVAFSVSDSGRLSVQGSAEAIRGTKEEILRLRETLVSAWLERDERRAIQSGGAA